MRGILFIWVFPVLLHLVTLALVRFTTVLQNMLSEAFSITLGIVPYALHQIGLPVLENNSYAGWLPLEWRSYKNFNGFLTGSHGSLYGFPWEHI